MVEIVSVMLLSEEGPYGVVYYKGTRYLVELNWLHYDEETERWNINKAYLTNTIEVVV